MNEHYEEETETKDMKKTKKKKQLDVGFVCGVWLSFLILPKEPSLPSSTAFGFCQSPHFIRLALHCSCLPSFSFLSMAEQNEKNDEQLLPWPDMTLPELPFSGAIADLHSKIETQWDPLRLSACQTAAGRALWSHAVHDPLAHLLAGETYLRSLHEKMKNDRIRNAREVSGVILAVRTLWFDSKIEAALSSFENGGSQLVLLGAGMDTRAYRLSCLKDSDVFEVDFNDVLQVKTAIIEAAEQDKHSQVMARSLTRVAADIREDDWLEKLNQEGYIPERSTVWVLEGILYYLPPSKAMEVLKIIADKVTRTKTVLLADFMNKPSTTLSNSTYQFYSDWPDQLLPSIGFSDVKLSQIGDPDARFGLMNDDPLNLFNKIRSLPRSFQIHPDDGTPCRRLYLVEASGSPISRPLVADI